MRVRRSDARAGTQRPEGRRAIRRGVPKPHSKRSYSHVFGYPSERRRQDHTGEDSVHRPPADRRTGLRRWTRCRRRDQSRAPADRDCLRRRARSLHAVVGTPEPRVLGRALPNSVGRRVSTIATRRSTPCTTGSSRNSPTTSTGHSRPSVPDLDRPVQRVALYRDLAETLDQVHELVRRRAIRRARR